MFVWQLLNSNSYHADFNGDNVTDLLWFRESNNSYFVSLVKNGSVDTYQYSGGGPNYGIWLVQLSGDFNGDGVTDMLWWKDSDNAYFVRLMEDGIPGEHMYLGGGGDQDIQLTGVGDFNGDGTTDLLWNRESNNAYFVTLVDNGVPGEFHYVGGGNDHDVIITGLGDFNSDETTDILWRRDSNGANFVTLIDHAGPGAFNYVGWGGDIDISVIGVGDFDGNGTDDFISQRESNGGGMGDFDRGC